MRSLSQLIAGRYELGAQIGRGGMAEVFEARDRSLGRSVAVKILAPPFDADPRFVDRFRREAACGRHVASSAGG